MEKFNIIPMTEQSPRFFSGKVLYSEIKPIKDYKVKWLNRLCSHKFVHFKTFFGDKQADFFDNCIIFFILQKITNSEQFETNIIGYDKNNIPKVLSGNYLEFKNQIKNIVKIEMKFLVGKEKTKYKLILDNFFNIMTISLSRFHLKEYEPTIIFNLLSKKVNEKLKYLDIIDCGFEKINF